MIRRLLPALVLAAAPAAAQEKPAWVGVWQGRVGTYPVRLCIDVTADRPARGAYYYTARMEPIALGEEDGEGGWIERHPSGESQALWEFSEQTGERLRGTWRQGRRSLAFELTPVGWEDTEFGDGPCTSQAFIEPRIQGGEVHYADAEFEGLRYSRAIYRPPPHLADDISIETFTFDANSAADAAINAELSSRLPAGWDDPWLQCLAGGLAATGQDGFFEQMLQPTLVTRDFLGVAESTSAYCGGAHPDYSTRTLTFDRANGTTIDLFDWIDRARAGRGSADIGDALRALVIARWPSGGDAECRELAAESDYWSLGLARDGLVFTPDMPHAATPCEEPVTVEWPGLDAFLSDAGRAGMARLRRG